MRTLSSSESDIVAAVHEGVHEQPLWTRFLSLLRDATGVSYATLFFRPPGGPNVQLASGRELPEAYQRQMFERFGEDPLPHRRMREGRVYALPELMDADDAAQRSFVAEILAPGGLSHVRSVRVTESGGTDVWMSIAHGRDPGAAAGSLLARLAPHLRIALHGLVTLGRERMRSSISSEVMGRLSFGWLTVDRHFRIVDAALDVERMFLATGLLRRGRDDRLILSSTVLDRDVASLVKRFDAGTETRARAFRLSMDPWIDIFVKPLHERFATPGSTAVAVVYISGDQWSRDDRCEQLVDLFGLLPSEARVAWSMAQARSIGATAHELGLTVQTARSYSKIIYAKMGVRSQSELVRIILSSVSVIM